MDFVATFRAGVRAGESKGLWTAAKWLVIPLAVAAVIFAASYYAAAYLTQKNAAQAPGRVDPGWTQAVGAVFAIIAGFAGVLFQVQRQKGEAEAQRTEAGKAAHLLAFDALDTVSDRLNAALTPANDKANHRLRGNRTTEMVTAMREFDFTRIPASMLADFIRLRSRIYAINERITELYSNEAARPAGWEREELEIERNRLLSSAVAVHEEAVTLYEGLQATAVSFGATSRSLRVHEAIDNYLDYGHLI